MNKNKGNVKTQESRAVLVKRVINYSDETSLSLSKRILPLQDVKF